MHFCVHYDFNTRAPTHATRFSLKSRKDCPGDHTEDEPNSIAHAFLRVLRREHSRILARISTCTINSDLRLWKKRNSWATDTRTPAHILDAFRCNKSCPKAQISQHAKKHPPTCASRFTLRQIHALPKIYVTYSKFFSPQFIRKNRPKVVSYEEALKQVKEEERYWQYSSKKQN